MVCLAAILGTGRTASADLSTDALGAGLLVTSTIPDVDLDSITRIYGFTGNQVLSLSGTVTTSGFNETLSGTYQGNSLNITYTGVSTGYPNTITWTTSGSYGLVDFTGGGSATFSFPTSSTFNINYLSSWGSSPTASDSLSITGAVDPTSLTYTATSGTITINGVGVAAPDTYNSILCPYTGKVSRGPGPYTDIDGPDGKPTIIDDVTITSVTTDQSGNLVSFAFSGSISTVPEPSSLILLALGSIGLFGYGRCRAKTGHRGASREGIRCAPDQRLAQTAYAGPDPA